MPTVPIQARLAGSPDAENIGAGCSSYDQAPSHRRLIFFIVTDQRSQFTSEDFTDVLKREGIRISMDGKGRWLDNVFVERLWRSVRYEEVYLRAYDSITEARASLGRYFTFYNTERRHQALDRRTPDSVYYESAVRLAA